MTLRWWSGVIGLVLGVGVLAATLLSLLAGVSWLFDLLANFRSQYVWIGALALAGLGAQRLWPAFAVVGLAVLFNVVAVAPYWMGSIGEPAGNGRLTILHLNTQSGNPEKAAIVEFVRESDADIVFLAEVTPRLRELLDESSLPFTVVAGTPRSTPIGVAALARDGSVTGRLTNLGASEVPAVLLDASIGGVEVQILGFHTSSPGEEGRAADRNDQLAAAGTIVATRSTPMVLVGDLNATPWTPAFRELIATGLTDAQRGRGVAGSWPSGWGPLMIPIDHVLHTGELTTTAFAFGPSVGSDHRSLRVELALRAP